jgi:ATP-binding cassette subfamily B protein
MQSFAIRRFQGVELFKDCRRSELERIDPLGTTVVVPPLRELCREGELGSEFFVLIDGVAEVEITVGRLALLHSGAWFGETALIHNSPRRASVRTLVESTLIVFTRREFNTLRRGLPRVRDRLDATAALFIRGDVPASRSWYQSVSTSVPAVAATAGR